MAYRKKKKRWKKQRYSLYFYNISGKAKMNEEYWNQTTAILTSMKKELEHLGEAPNKNKSVDVIKYCLSFLDVTSRYQDLLDGGIKISPFEKRKVASVFNDNLAYFGRHTEKDCMKSAANTDIPFWNITSKNEAITENNIFFGPDIGMSRKPASYWIHLSKSKHIEITITKNYKKGCLKKVEKMWPTDALVKYSLIYTISQKGRKVLIDNLNNLLT